MHPSCRLIPLVLGVACGGGDGSVAPAASSAPAPARREAAPAPEATLGEQFLVIVASSRQASEAEAALGRVRAQGEAGPRAGTLASSRFKNLMPCYTVAIADALPDRAAALELSKRLKAAGIDNYVKNAGAWVGPSAAIDAYCAGSEVAATGGPTARRLALAGGRAWVPTEGTIPAGLPKHQRLGDGYDAWLQPLAGAPSAGGGAWLAFDVERGASRSCAVKGQGVLTLGTPHFGLLQEEPKPSAPACGEPQLMAELDCALAEGTWLALPAGSSPRALARTAAEVPELKKAALAELERWPAWRGLASAGAETPLQKKVTVSRWKGSRGEVHLVEGVLFDELGPCGGEDTAFRAVFAVDGAGLGRRLGPFIEEPFSTLVSLVDVEDDGAPELVTRAFPDTVSLTGADGTLRLRDAIAYCDCAC